MHVEFNKDRPVGDGPAQQRPGSDPQVVECPCDEQMGRFRKKHAYDCGKTQCRICHGEKFPKRQLSRQEIMAELRFKEQSRELHPEVS